MHVGDRPLLTESFDDWCDLRVVGVIDSRKEMVLYLVVESSVDEAEPRATHV